MTLPSLVSGDKVTATSTMTPLDDYSRPPDSPRSLAEEAIEYLLAKIEERNQLLIRVAQ